MPNSERRNVNGLLLTLYVSGLVDTVGSLEGDKSGTPRACSPCTAARLLGFIPLVTSSRIIIPLVAPSRHRVLQ